MDDKNELNDLLLGNQKDSNHSKKFFLIVAGVLLLFFIIIGIMKFMSSSETKQPLPITATEQPKKMDMPSPAAADNNTTTDDSDDSNITADEKIDAIVKKLQQEAKENAVAAPAESVPVVDAKPKPLPITPQTTEPVKQEPKTTVVTIPIKSVGEKNTSQKQPVAAISKESQIKSAKNQDDVKKAFKDATKNASKPVAKETKPKVIADKNSSQAAGRFFIQVGYVDTESQAQLLRDKVNSIGYGSITKASVKDEKNITKVWAGPFDSKEDAQKALPKIRQQIKNDAFITKE